MTQPSTLRATAAAIALACLCTGTAHAAWEISGAGAPVNLTFDTDGSGTGGDCPPPSTCFVGPSGDCESNWICADGSTVAIPSDLSAYITTGPAPDCVITVDTTQLESDLCGS